jgi:hypothetical protein
MWGKQLEGSTRNWDTIKAVDTTQEAAKSTDKDPESVEVATADKDMFAGAWDRQHCLWITLRIHRMQVDVGRTEYLVEYLWQVVTRQQQRQSILKHCKAVCKLEHMLLMWIGYQGQTHDPDLPYALAEDKPPCEIHAQECTAVNQRRV